MKIWWNYNLVKGKVDKTTRLWNENLMEQQVCEMKSWQKQQTGKIKIWRNNKLVKKLTKHQAGKRKNWWKNKLMQQYNVKWVRRQDNILTNEEVDEITNEENAKLMNLKYWQNVKGA